MDCCESADMALSRGLLDPTISIYLLIFISNKPHFRFNWGKKKGRIFDSQTSIINTTQCVMLSDRENIKST